MVEIARIANIQQSQPIVDGEGRAVAWFLRALNQNFVNLAELVNAIATLPEIQEALERLDEATQAALDAADRAEREQALVNSYIVPDSVATADASTITIAAHQRRYADANNTTVNVNGGTVPAPAAGSVAYVFYVDPSRAGGSVQYQVSATQPVQTNNTHVVEAVRIPAAGQPPNEGGGGPRPPGYVVERDRLQ